VSQRLVNEAARGVPGVAQRAAGGVAGGRRRSSARVRVASLETKDGDDDERMALLELVEPRADGDLVRAMPAFAADRIMEAEVETRTGAAKGRRAMVAGS